jgi:hypothetical protein
MHSMTIVSLKDIPVPLTIGDSCKGVQGQQQSVLDLSKHRAGTSELFYIYLFTAGISDSVARWKFSPTTTTAVANDYYTNAPCPRRYCVDQLRAAA